METPCPAGAVDVDMAAAWQKSNLSKSLAQVGAQRTRRRAPRLQHCGHGALRRESVPSNLAPRRLFRYESSHVKASSHHRSRAGRTGNGDVAGQGRARRHHHRETTARRGRTSAIEGDGYRLTSGRPSSCTHKSSKKFSPPSARPAPRSADEETRPAIPGWFLARAAS